MLDCTGALIGEQCGSCYREGVLTVVVFEISPSYVKTFYYRPNTYNHHHYPTSTLCDVSALALGLNFKDPGS